MKNLFPFMLFFLLLAGMLWAAPKDTPKSTKQPKSADPCMLLTRGDIQAVQGDAVQETNPSTPPFGGLVLSQCLFRTANPSKSVSVAIASAGSTSPRAFWQKQFRSGRPEFGEKQRENAEAGRKDEKEKEEEGTQARAIQGVGEQAYWVGSPMVGALYVLKGDTFLRISVGGIREESVRIEKSKALARIAIKRM